MRAQYEYAMRRRMYVLRFVLSRPRCCAREDAARQGHANCARCKGSAVRSERLRRLIPAAVLQVCYMLYGPAAVAR